MYHGVLHSVCSCLLLLAVDRDKNDVLIDEKYIKSMFMSRAV